MQKLIISLILTAFISSTFAGDKFKLDPVQKKYKGKLQYLKKQYENGVAKIKKQMLRDYQALLKQKMRSGDLKGATAIQAKIDKLSGEKKDTEGDNKEDELDFEIGIPESPLGRDSFEIGSVEDSVEKVMLASKHKIQLWRVLPEYFVSGKYKLSAKHAAKGKEGAFYLTAWADTNGDGIPDKKIGKSKKMSAKKRGDWSSWVFSVKSQKALFVGMSWKEPNTLIYYQVGGVAPNGYIGLGDAVYYARNTGESPTKSAKPRYTNIKLYTPKK